MGFACTGLTAAELMGEIKWMKKLLCGAFCSLEMQFFDVSLAVFVLSHAVCLSCSNICLIYSLEWCCTQVPLSKMTMSHYFGESK